MIGDVVGYCEIKPDAKVQAASPDKFRGKIVRVMEFQRDGDGALVISSDATELGMVEADAIRRKFECSSQGEVLMPPGLDLIGQMAYATKVMTRKGGYNNLLKQMVIQASLMKGEFCDNFLFQKEEEERARSGNGSADCGISDVMDYISTKQNNKTP